MPRRPPGEQEPLSGSHALEAYGLAGDRASPIHRLDPRAKILGLVSVTLVAVSTPLAAWPIFVACAGALGGVAAVARVGPSTLWRRTRVVLPLVLFVALFLPFVRDGGRLFTLGPLTVSEAGLVVFGEVSAKATIGTASAVLLGATTSYPQVLRGLEALRVPRLLTLIASLMYRYLFVVIGEARRTRAALAARGYRPRQALRAGPIGRAMTALFLRSYGRGERVHLAMLARGFTGAMPHLEPLAFTRADVGFVALMAGALVSLRVASGLA